MIAKSIYESIIKSRAWGERFNPELSTEVAEKLSKMEPRQMKVSLIRAFGQAAIQGRNFIAPDDIPNVSDRNQMGFL
jgi:hypothetical protein